ncbi:neutral/alkaline non-lysosomal ceramidase N-terminal domain-containing protein [uncultured Cyclobacterium sp.]|uniref:neutral/alkaline non-lysosomal ceramidase N-terminal domain-containing protein n=1 Tax=uncultured Cyclobacterium sp. TaxID=453820 RepID=UPI0030EF6E7D|tara:strand:+ start:7501 stop:8907 length:1407 start_codon:yes stop_codon:yes gene_type:complete
MKIILPSSCHLIFFALTILLLGQEVHAQQNNSFWKAGVGRVEITPKESIWMGGYAARDHPSKGVRHSVWAKALAIEDPNGKLAVVVTTDLLAFRKFLSDRIRDQLKDKYGLSRDQIILNSSHTHTGPETDYPRYEFQLSKIEYTKIKQFSGRVEKEIVELVGKVIESLEPVTLSSENGVTRFQVNRRKNKEAQINAQTELKGPNDYAVPVIRVEDKKGNIKAILFGYACHPTVMSDYQISGDYAGFAQIELEKLYPGATALFFQGAGADQNPLPRRSAPLAQQYGKELAAAVERIINEDMNILEGTLSTAYSEIDLTFAKAVPTKSELEDIISGVIPGYPDYLKEYAKIWIARLDKGEEIKDTYPYPVQAWKIGDQPLFALGGELLVGYSLELKKIFGPDIIVMGYSNDVMGYIPTKVVLAEGGYEANRSPLFTTQWATSIEDKILSEAVNLAESVGIKTVEYPLVNP